MRDFKVEMGSFGNFMFLRCEGGWNAEDGIWPHELWPMSRSVHPVLVRSAIPQPQSNVPIFHSVLSLLLLLVLL